MQLIDSDALFKEFERAAWYNNADRDEIAEEILLQMPTIDAVLVVRCGECKHRIDVDYANGHACLKRSSYYYCEDNDFCSYGERRYSDG